MIRLQLEWVLLWCTAWVCVCVDMWNSETTVRSDYVFDCFHWLIVSYLSFQCMCMFIQVYASIWVKGVFFFSPLCTFWKEKKNNVESIYYRTISNTLTIFVTINLNSGFIDSANLLVWLHWNKHNVLCIIYAAHKYQLHTINYSHSFNQIKWYWKLEIAIGCLNFFFFVCRFFWLLEIYWHYFGKSYVGL